MQLELMASFFGLLANAFPELVGYTDPRVLEEDYSDKCHTSV